MNNLMEVPNTIKSTELVEIINTFRKEEGNNTGLQHKHFMEKIRKEIETLESLGLKGQPNFRPSSYINLQNKKQPCFELNRDGMLEMLNSESAYVRFRTVEYIDKLEKQLRQPKDSYAIADPVERAKAWIREEEERQQLRKKSQEKAKQLEQQKPKVLFADSVQASTTSILVGELAKILKQNGIEIGQNRLFAWMRDNGYLISRKGTDYNMPTQKSMDLRLFTIRETTINHSDGHISVSKTPKVTGKGQVYFINIFKKTEENAKEG